MTKAATLPTGWLKKKIDYRFTDPDLLRSALTHRSGRGENNERLEFLGDAILGFVVARELYRLFPDAREGELTRRRAQLVKRATLAEIASELGLGEHLMLGAGELKSGGFRRDSILSDALEALIGAIYLDGGVRSAGRVVRRLLGDRMTSARVAELKDPKSRLQEFLQAKGQALPDYEVTGISGKAHRQTFTVSCVLAARGIATTGAGTTRRRAEQDAAAKALAQVSDSDR